MLIGHLEPESMAGAWAWRVDATQAPEIWSKQEKLGSPEVDVCGPCPIFGVLIPMIASKYVPLPNSIERDSDAIDISAKDQFVSGKGGS